jgi:hypothetical protein
MSKVQRVILDINAPEFLTVFLSLRGPDLEYVASSLNYIRGLDWQTVYTSKSLNWEVVRHLTGSNGNRLHSIRLSKKIRALVYRQDNFMRFVSLHPDHDSAYK